MLVRRLLIALLALCAGAAYGASVGGVRLDDQVAVGGKELVLNGAGIRTRLAFKVYVGSLYLSKKTSDPEAVLASSPRRIQLNLLRTLTAEQLVDALVQGLKDNNSAQDMTSLSAQTDQLVTIMKGFREVKEGDVVALDFVDGATAIRLNGEARGSIAGDGFSKALTRIWLGDKPVQGDLKNAMLGR